jgi:hypothetical protein
MMLAKLIALRPKDVLSMTTQRTCTMSLFFVQTMSYHLVDLKYRGRDITALRDIAQSCIDENLQAFKNTLDLYQKGKTQLFFHSLIFNLLKKNN